MWPNNGSWFRRSTLKPLATCIGDVDVEESDFGQGFFDGNGIGPKAYDEMMAAKTAVQLGESATRNQDDWDSGEESSEADEEDSEESEFQGFDDDPEGEILTEI